jgi:carboxyl-terminal processing protease
MPRLLLTLVGCLGILTAIAQSSRDFRSEVGALGKLLSEKHFSPRVINDNFSEEIFDNFLKELDPHGLYFTTVELSTIAKFRTLLDEQIAGQDWTFLPKIVPLYRSALERAKTVVQKQSEIAFLAAARNNIFQDTVTWVASEKELLTRWRNTLHYQTLVKLADLQKANSASPQFFAKYEPEARIRTRMKVVREINRILQEKKGLEVYVAEKFLKSITIAYDPHTAYFNLTNMEVFSAMISAEEFYFGFSLKENELGKVVISSLAPGGPAWKSGIFQLQDELVALQWEDEEAIDLSDLPLYEINGLLDDANQTKTKFTVRKINGELKTVTLQKEKLSQEENLVRGYVLDGKDGHRYGYVVLPRFYTEFGVDDYAATRCANDVAKEIMKLNKEKIQGIILDVRNNGGGSLKEAIALSGIFLEEGAMAMMKHTGQEPMSLKDMNRGTLYDGPMTLMVNNSSASASEVVAAALQDYHRALVVGSRTFGKATGQEVMALNPSQDLRKLALDGHFGFAKVTTSRIYRVTGKSLQGKGLVPDISLPNFFDVFNYHESILENTLKVDSITKKSYYRPLAAFPVDALREKSKTRVAGSPGFQAIARAMKTYEKVLNDSMPEVVTWENLERQAEEERRMSAGMAKALESEIGVFHARVISTEKERLGLDAYAKDFHQSSVQSMEKDIYLSEVFLIMNDLVDLNKN